MWGETGQDEQLRLSQQGNMDLPKMPEGQWLTVPTDRLLLVLVVDGRWRRVAAGKQGNE